MVGIVVDQFPNPLLDPKYSNAERFVDSLHYSTYSDRYNCLLYLENVIVVVRVVLFDSTVENDHNKNNNRSACDYFFYIGNMQN